MKISATILAAGGSTRMDGENKLLLSLKGVPILVRVFDTVTSAGFHPIIVVTGYDAENIHAAMEGREAIFVHNEAWQTGMASSIKTGISTLPPDVHGNLVALGDMPFVSRKTLLRLRISFEKSGGDRIVYPIYSGRQANPVLFPRKYFKEIILSKGDRGCKSIVQENPEDTIPIPIASEEVILDCDTKEDYLLLINLINS